jgi:hypothetical protein
MDWQPLIGQNHQALFSDDSDADMPAVELLPDAADTTTQKTPDITTRAHTEDINGVGVLNPLLVAACILGALALIAVVIAVVSIRRKKAQRL